MLQTDDRRLAYEVEKALGRLPGISLKQFRVEVVRGIARVQGVARSLDDKQAALDAASRVDGVRGVTEAIAVETPAEITDPELEQSLGAAMAEDERVEARRVGASAVRGQAVLRGTADSLEQLAAASETAGTVAGTVSTIDSCRIENTYGADRLDLVNAVASALAAHPELHTRSIRPLLDDDAGRVLLTGTVRSDEEKRQALNLAAAVPGVRSVRETLSVVP